MNWFLSFVMQTLGCLGLAAAAIATYALMIGLVRRSYGRD